MFAGLFSDFKNYGDRWVYSLTDNTPIQSPVTPSGISLLGSNGCGYDPDIPVTASRRNSRIQRPNPPPRHRVLAALLIGGKHDLTSTWFAWDVSGFALPR